MRRRLAALVAALSLVAGLNVALASSASAHPYCGIVWGSLAKQVAGAPSGEVTDIRAGRHACYDRLVLDVSAPLQGYSVRYVSQLVDPETGYAQPVRGGARLEVAARAPSIATDAWFLPDSSLANTSGYRTFRDVQFIGNFENTTTIGLGVRARLPFRAFVLPGPGAGSRLVVDVAHQWCATGHAC